jgi:hypothetical protein
MVEFNSIKERLQAQVIVDSYHVHAVKSFKLKFNAKQGVCAELLRPGQDRTGQQLGRYC